MREGHIKRLLSKNDTLLRCIRFLLSNFNLLYLLNQYRLPPNFCVTFLNRLQPGRASRESEDAFRRNVQTLALYEAPIFVGVMAADWRIKQMCQRDGDELPANTAQSRMWWLGSWQICFRWSSKCTPTCTSTRELQNRGVILIPRIKNVLRHQIPAVFAT